VTHYNVNYDGLAWDAKRAKALKDIKDWLGAKRYREATLAFRAIQPPTRHGFALQVSLAGISGFPVNVWYEELWNPTQHDLHVYYYYLK